MSAPHDPFIRLTHLWTADGIHRSSPIYILPGEVREIINGEVHMNGNYSFAVSEKAEQIHAMVIAKLAENKQAETLGKT